MTRENECHTRAAGQDAANANLTEKLSPEDFANLGGGRIAYMRPIRSEDAAAMFPQANLAPGLQLFALHAADGTPMMLTDSRDAVIAGAIQNDLTMLSIH